MTLGELLSQPITQFGGLITLAVLLQKSGVDIVSILKWLFSKPQDGEAPGEKLVTLQELKLMMANVAESQGHLREHYNDVTTDKLDMIEQTQKVLIEKIDGHIRAHDRTNFILEDIKNNGIKCNR